MTNPIDPRRGWVRQRILELQQSGLSYKDARAQADAEADDKFGTEENGDNGNGDNGNGATA